MNFPKKGDEIVDNTRQTKMFISAMALAGIGAAGYAGFASHTLHIYYALALLALSTLTSRMKVKLPGIEGNMSVNLPFLLTAVVNLSAAEAVVIAGISTMVQCWPKPESKFRPDQMLFNVSMMAFATSVASVMWHAGWVGKSAWASESLMLASATATFFLGQTAPVAGIIKLTEGAAMRRVWMGIAQLTLPYYVLSAGMTSMVNFMSHHVGWQLALAIFPVMYGIHRSYRVYFGRAAENQRPVGLAKSASAGA
ncbi:MAG TPA: hypothetical protein VIW68_04370 [Candidatus Sulfotelmatobacter sp.]